MSTPTKNDATKQPDKIDQILDGNGDVPPWKRKTPLPVIDVTPDAIDTPNEGVDFEALLEKQQHGNGAALVTADDSEQFAPSGRVYEEFYDFESKDLHIPRLRLLGGQSQEVTERQASAGQFIMFGQPACDTLELVVIAATPFRDYRIGEDRVQMCQSFDGKIGVGTPGGVCAHCPKAQWGEKNPLTGKSKSPECSEGFSYQIFSLTHEQMAVWDLSRTGLDAARKINASLKMRRYRNFVVRVAAEKRDGPARSTYFAPIIDIRPITHEERELVDHNVFV